MADLVVPEVIARYLAAAATSDVEAVVRCFTDDAVVLGEGQTLRGHEEIRRRKALGSQYTYATRVLGVDVVGANSYVVHGRLEGDFPGSPLELTFRFSLRDALIAGLGIAPSATRQDAPGDPTADDPVVCLEQAVRPAP